MKHTYESLKQWLEQLKKQSRVVLTTYPKKYE